MARVDRDPVHCACVAQLTPFQQDLVVGEGVLGTIRQLDLTIELVQIRVGQVAGDRGTREIAEHICFVQGQVSDFAPSLFHFQIRFPVEPFRLDVGYSLR